MAAVTLAETQRGYLRVKPFDKVFHFVVVSMKAAFTPTYSKMTSTTFDKGAWTPTFSSFLPTSSCHKTSDMEGNGINKNNMSVNKSVLSSQKYRYISIYDLELHNKTYAKR